MQLADEFLRKPASTDPAEGTTDAPYPLVTCRLRSVLLATSMTGSGRPEPAIGRLRTAAQQLIADFDHPTTAKERGPACDSSRLSVRGRPSADFQLADLAAGKLPLGI